MDKQEMIENALNYRLINSRMAEILADLSEVDVQDALNALDQTCERCDGRHTHNDPVMNFINMTTREKHVLCGDCVNVYHSTKHLRRYTEDSIIGNCPNCSDDVLDLYNVGDAPNNPFCVNPNCDYR